MTAADHGIDNHALTLSAGAYAFTYGINNAEKLMTNNAWVLGERIMPTENMHV
jgi:hypothetical protein